jgi:hypothetical protein
MDFTGFAVQVGNVQLRLSFQGIDKLVEEDWSSHDESKPP